MFRCFKLNIMHKIILISSLFMIVFSCKKLPTTPYVVVDSTPLIGGLDCAGATVSGKLYKNEVAEEVTIKVNYTDGNGKLYDYQTINSVGVTGLTADLDSDSLANGNGSIIYKITGTPTSSGVAEFPISLGGMSCKVSINVEESKPTSGYGPEITDVDGNTYKTVFIGTQHWMAENLKTSKYSDGTLILNLKNDTEWNNNITGAWRYYANDSNYNAKYGKLYNWYATNQIANGGKNVCPAGWHVPSESEWVVLSEFIGNDGGKLKAEGSEWQSPNSGATNSTLFTALPGGYTLGGLGNTGYWWSTKEVNSTIAHNRGMLNLNTSFYSNYDKRKTLGCSIRCLKD